MAELSLIAKATVVLVLGLAAAAVARRASSAFRGLILAATFGALVLLPVAAALVPERLVPIAIPEAGVVVFVDEAPALDAIAPAASPPIAPRRSAWTLPSPQATLRALWAAGFLMTSLPMALALWRLRELHARGRRWRDGETLAHQLASGGAIARVRVFLYDELRTPMTYGVRQPVIAFPADAPSWSDASLQRALIHETEHVRRLDWPLHIAARFVCALYWFHPLAWIAWRRLCLECERACDDAVLRQHAPSADYAEQLLTLARRMSGRTPAPMLSMAGAGNLSARVRAVLDPSQARGHAGALATVALVAVGTAVTLAISPLQAVTRDEPSPPQQQAAAFEVASIRPNSSGAPLIRGVEVRPGGRIVAENAPVSLLVTLAYDVDIMQLTGGPGWINTERYDLDALAPGDASPDDMRAMLRRLLAERFSLAVHTERRERPTFDLLPVRADRSPGPSLRRSGSECAPIRPPSGFPAPPPPPPPAGPDDGAKPLLPPGVGAIRCGRMFLPGFLGARQITMEDFATTLSRFVRRPVVDRTGLDGTYDVDVSFTMETGPPGAASLPPVEGRPELFTALREQLGLKLEPSRAEVAMLVIDRVERPTEN